MTVDSYLVGSMKESIPLLARFVHTGRTNPQLQFFISFQRQSEELIRAEDHVSSVLAIQHIHTMDPELARIRRERYLAQKGKTEEASGKREGGNVDEDLVPSKSTTTTASNASVTNAKRGAKDEEEVIDLLDSDDDDEEVTSNISSKRPMSKRQDADAAIGVDAGHETKMTVSRHGGGDDDDDSVECLSGPIKAKPHKRSRTNHSTHICYLDESTKRLHDTHPQTIDNGHDGWIWAHCPSRNSASRTTPDVEGMAQEFQRMVSRESNATNITGRQVLDLAIKHNVKSGKWMIFHKETPALLWQQIRDAVLNGDFGHSAKISTTPSPAVFIICIYTPDFTDKTEVHRIRRAMHSIMDNGKYSLSFKPDCYTYLDINTGNRYKIPPTIYACGGKNDVECTTLRIKW